MASEVKQRIGTVPCPLCGTICAVKVNGRDTLNYVCHTGCDNPGWAKAGTLAHEIITSRMTRTDTAKPAEKPAAPKPATAQEVKPAAQPLPKPAKLGFFS